MYTLTDLVILNIMYRTVSNVVNKLALDGSPHQAKCGLRAVLSINSGVDRFFTQLYKVLILFSCLISTLIRRVLIIVLA